MNNKNGFTLVEVLVAMVVTLIAATGFFGYIYSAIAQRTALEKNNTAYTIAVDIADRLAKLPRGHALILPKTGNEKYVGYDGSYVLKKCSGTTLTAVSPTVDGNGTTEYTNPWGANQLYLYDKNTGGFGAGAVITAASNANIDHPNSTTDTTYVTTINSVVNPVRRIQNGTTFYAVWSVSYMPCGSTDNSMIFITVYWIDPEPSETDVSSVNSKISATNQAYRVKSISVAMEKAYKVEQ